MGTVNVDETTYMFSPKVLDRANTFEFRVETESFKSDTKKPVRCEVGDQALVRGLLEMSRDEEWQHSNPAPFREEISKKLRHLHATLGRFNMEFGHRVYYESLRFSALAYAAGLSEMEQVLDRIVMQKILPRLHGSRKRLELPLLALAQFCRDVPESVDVDERLISWYAEQATGTAKLPISFAKLSRMISSIRVNQFASFTE